MSRRSQRFDQLYTDVPDPWSFRTSPYERGKYATSIAALPRRHYARGIEAGCSIGELTALLAGICGEVIGVDVSEVALGAARRRCSPYTNASFVRADLPVGWPEVKADLVVFSEFLYFLSPDEIQQMADVTWTNWAEDGHILIVSFCGNTSEDLQGVESAELMIEALGRKGAQLHASEAHEGYHLHVLQRPSGQGSHTTRKDRHDHTEP